MPMLIEHIDAKPNDRNREALFLEFNSSRLRTHSLKLF